MASMIALGFQLGSCCRDVAYGRHMHAPQAGQHPAVQPRHVSSPCHRSHAAHSHSQTSAQRRYRLWWAVCVTSMASEARRLSKGTSLRGRTARHARDRRAGELPSLQLGTQLTGTVKDIEDVGAFLATKNGSKLFIPTLRMLRPKEDYIIGEELKVTVIRLPRKGVISDSVKVTDMPMKPLSCVQRGSVVDGRVVHISDHGVIFDINVPTGGFAHWRYLEPLGKDRSEFQLGDVIRGLKVRQVGRSNVNLGAPSLQVRPIQDFKPGQEVKGFVVHVVPNINAVFLDIDATVNAAALGRKNHLAKTVRDYSVGEEILLEVSKVTRVGIEVKDLGRKAHGALAE